LLAAVVFVMLSRTFSSPGGERGTDLGEVGVDERVGVPVAINA